ncbi:MAG: DUF4190 domain-containing protein [Acidothermus cellulolyticus]|nr:DUF4190 domain-containing protein [Acidothermus cellulolyticus]
MPPASQSAGWPGPPGASSVPHFGNGGDPPGAYSRYGDDDPRLSPPTNGFAIASLVLGILWLWWIGSILALIFGYVGLSQIRQRKERGRGLAIAGVVLGWVGIGLLLIDVVAAVAGVPANYGSD